MPENTWGGVPVVAYFSVALESELHDSQWQSTSAGAVCQWSVHSLVPHYVVGLTPILEWWLLLGAGL